MTSPSPPTETLDEARKSLILDPAPGYPNHAICKHCGYLWARGDINRHRMDCVLVDDPRAALPPVGPAPAETLGCKICGATVLNYDNATELLKDGVFNFEGNRKGTLKEKAADIIERQGKGIPDGDVIRTAAPAVGTTLDREKLLAWYRDYIGPQITNGDMDEGRAKARAAMREQSTVRFVDALLAAFPSLSQPPAQRVTREEIAAELYNHDPVIIEGDSSPMPWGKKLKAECPATTRRYLAQADAILKLLAGGELTSLVSSASGAREQKGVCK